MHMSLLRRTLTAGALSATLLAPSLAVAQSAILEGERFATLPLFILRIGGVDLDLFSGRLVKVRDRGVDNGQRLKTNINARQKFECRPSPSVTACWNASCGQFLAAIAARFKVGPRGGQPIHLLIKMLLTFRAYATKRHCTRRQPLIRIVGPQR